MKEAQDLEEALGHPILKDLPLFVKGSQEGMRHYIDLVGGIMKRRRLCIGLLREIMERKEIFCIDPEG